MRNNINKPIPLSFTFLRCAAKVNPLIVNYHIVSDKHLPYIINLYKYRDIKTFKEDLIFFKRKYHPIGLTELLNGVKTNESLPRNSLLLTFDDGFAEVYNTIAPILHDFNLTATSFLTKNFIDNRELGFDNKASIIVEELLKNEDIHLKQKILNILNVPDLTDMNLSEKIINLPYSSRNLVDEIALIMNIDFEKILKEDKPYMTTTQIQELIKEGFTFGAHSIDHARFNQLSLPKQINQTTESVKYICNKFKLNYKVFAFPYTDIGITRSYFNSISQYCDLTFGTQGLLSDQAKTNYQRLSVEKFEQPAKKILKFHYTRRIFYQLMNKHQIKRIN